MAEGDGTLYNIFKYRMLNGIYNLANAQDAIHLILVGSYTPSVSAHTVYADSDVADAQYAAGSGYTTDGAVLANQAISQDDTDNEGVFDADDVTFSSLGPLSPSIPSHAILFDNTPTSPADPLIGYIEVGVTAPNGANYTFAWNAEGIINLT